MDKDIVRMDMDDDLIVWLSGMHGLWGGDSVLIDVGAYHGDFTRNMLELDVFKEAYMFEPNPENLACLRSQNYGDSVHIVETAVGDKVGSVPFFFEDDLATGSVLKYSEEQNIGRNISSIEVNQTTLDSFWIARNSEEKIGLIKIDTQGNDLNVLNGATSILNLFRPWLVVEVIFTHLYESQAKPSEIWDWCDEMEYMIAGMFNEHYADEGWLAFADAVLVPKEVIASAKAPYHLKRSAVQDVEINILHKVCEERLQLINELSG